MNFCSLILSLISCDEKANLTDDMHIFLKEKHSHDVKMMDYKSFRNVIKTWIHCRSPWSQLTQTRTGLMGLRGDVSKGDVVSILLRVRDILQRASWTCRWWNTSPWISPKKSIHLVQNFSHEQCHFLSEVLPCVHFRSPASGKWPFFKPPSEEQENPKVSGPWGTPCIWPLFLGTYLLIFPRWNVSRIAWGNKWQTPKWTEHLATLAVRPRRFEVSKPWGEGFGGKKNTVQVGYLNLKNMKGIYIFWKR